jgi:hypothetical protein
MRPKATGNAFLLATFLSDFTVENNPLRMTVVRGLMSGPECWTSMLMNFTTSTCMLKPTPD